MTIKIINVLNLKTIEDKEKIENQLRLTRLDFTVSLINECVTVKGTADEVRVATVAINTAGYQVK